MYLLILVNNFWNKYIYMYKYCLVFCLLRVSFIFKLLFFVGGILFYLLFLLFSIDIFIINIICN